METFVTKFRSLLKTAFFFSLAACLSPVLLCSFICVQASRSCWLKILGLKYPQYEFSDTRKIRTLVDTTRNPGIFHFLLHVNGVCHFDTIKEHFQQNVIEKRNKSGELRYPKLRRKLTSVWGNYAWMLDDSDFDLENHLIYNTGSNYRGRPVTEQNIQEYVSDIVAKYIPIDKPQWQVIVIPITAIGAMASYDTASNVEIDSYYILVRIHHLIIAEETDLQISEILMLNPDKSKSPINIAAESSKLMDFVQKPIHIPELYSQIQMIVSNKWNEFIYRYDPLESPDNDKSKQICRLSRLMSVLFITAVTVINDFVKGFKKTNNQLNYKIRFFVNLCRREAAKRDLTKEAVYNSIYFSINPINIVKGIFSLLWWSALNVLVFWPYQFYKELTALKEIIVSGHTSPTGTFIGFFYVYAPLMFCSGIELFNISKEILEAPKNMYEELFEYRSKEPNVLQAKSYCGRKVISYSSTINLEEMESFSTLSEVGSSEFVYACLGGSILNYFELFRDHPIPKLINITSRCIKKEYLLEKYNKMTHIGGIVLLQLPLQVPNREQIQQISKSIERIRKKQLAIYLISIGQTHFDILTSILPDVWSKVLINYFSFNFPITVTEIFGNSTQIETIWGQTLNNILLFRPPQSKTCLSLAIHRFGSKCQLSVMADSQLAPDHAKISIAWENFMRRTKI